jgi:HEAT repeat protein
MSEPVRPEVLISRLMSDQQPWRMDAEARLIAMGAPAVEPLIHALRHAQPAVRAHAVHALSRIGDERGIAPVIQALGDGENLGAVAIAAEKALVEWGEPVKPALRDAASSGDEAVRARALRALGRIGGRELKSFFEGLLKHSLPSVRTQAASALAQVAGEEAIPLLVPLLQDSDKWVRYGVAEALMSQRCVRGEAVLAQARDDEEEQGGHIPFWAEELLDEAAELRRTGRAIL